MTTIKPETDHNIAVEMTDEDIERLDIPELADDFYENTATVNLLETL